MTPEMSKSVSESLVREAVTKIREHERELCHMLRDGRTFTAEQAEPHEARISELTQPLIAAMVLCERQNKLLMHIGAALAKPYSDKNDIRKIIAEFK